MMVRLGSPSFNRTSMELKLGRDVKLWPVSILLIEPVWNWNVDKELEAIKNEIKLLIEPVWNWNWSY